MSYQITSSPSFQPYTKPQVCIPLYARRASAFSSGSLRMFVVLTLLYLVVRRVADLVFTTDVFNSALRRLAETLPYKGDNSFRSQATTQDVRTFIAERRQSELLFLRLPSPAEPLPAPKTYVVARRVEQATVPRLCGRPAAHRRSHSCVGHRAHGKWSISSDVG